MIETVNHEFKHNPKLIAFYEAAIVKMYFLNLDSVREDFSPLFSSTDKPSNQLAGVVSVVHLYVSF